MKYVKYDVINQIKNNIDYYKTFFTDENFESNLIDEFSRNYYEHSDINYTPIQYDMSIVEKKDRKKTDFQNAIKVYETYRFLNESQASDERLWSGLCLEKDNMNYIFYRWGQTKETIRYRLTFHAPGKRGLAYHGLARLWWFAHLTYVDKTQDPYELTRFIFEYPHIMEKMIYRNFSNSKAIRLAVISAIKIFIDNGGSYAVKKIDELYKFIGLIGGNRLLDVIPRNELIQELLGFLEDLD
jgi:hypothetical protein